MTRKQTEIDDIKKDASVTAIEGKKNEKEKTASGEPVKTKDESSKSKIADYFFRSCALIISIVSIVLTLTFQTRAMRADQFSKAKAGDVAAQVFLANHYYEIGDMSESLYWYKIAAASEGELGALAKNNLAVLYIDKGVDKEELGEIEADWYVREYYGEDIDSLYINDSYNMRIRLYNLFKKAFEEGLDEAGLNMYAYLMQSPEVYFTGLDYDNEKAWVSKELENRGIWEEVSSHEFSGCSVIGVEKSEEWFPDFGENRFYVLIDSDYSVEPTLFTYLVYEKIGGQSYKFKYVYPN